MRLPFETWLANQGLSDDAVALLEEAIACYRASAYKAALLFSYLGLLREIAYRVLSAAPPTGISNKFWADLQGSLLDDDGWEKALNNALSRRKTPIFDIDEDLFNQLDYWRHRRNDCAHARRQEITASHVEMLWAFIRSNISFIQVNGSEANLLERFERHYNVKFTPPGRPVTDLVRQIPTSVRSQNLPRFIEEICSLALKQEGELRGYQDLWAPLVWELLQLKAAVVDQPISELLKSKPEWLIRLLAQHPEKVVLLGNDPQEIRHFWHETVWTAGGPDDLWFGEYCNNVSLRILISLLDHGMIPDDQIQELLRVVAQCVGSWMQDFDIDTGLLDRLGEYGLADAIRVETREQGYTELSWLQRGEEIIWWYIRHEELDEQMATEFNRVLFVEGNLRNPPEYRDADRFWAIENLNRLKKLYQFEELVAKSCHDTDDFFRVLKDWRSKNSS